MSATLDKDQPITFSICSEGTIAELEKIAKEKPAIGTAIPTVEGIKTAMAVVREELAKAMKRISKRYPEHKEHKLKHILAIEVLTAIFKEHLEENTSPINSVDYILTVMDEIWESIKKKGD